jgi:hypothetical protein
MDRPSIKSVAGLIGEMQELKLAEKTQTHWRMWFRGHSKIGWPLEPGVYRSNFGNYPTESARLSAEQSLYQQFRVMSAGLRSGQESPEDIYFLQQHYRMPTRLLDWTTSALTALYFACCGNDDSDGEIFIMDAWAFGPEARPKWSKGVATSRREEFQVAIATIDRWRSATDFPKYIIPVRPDAFDQRITLQRSCFTFHVPGHERVTKSENATLQTWTVAGSSKQRVRRELSLLGIDHFSIFGDLEHLAGWLKEARGIEP